MSYQATLIVKERQQFGDHDEQEIVAHGWGDSRKDLIDAASRAVLKFCLQQGDAAWLTEVQEHFKKNQMGVG